MDYIIKNAVLLDANLNGVKANVLVSGDRIAAVGRVPETAGAGVIDLTGYTLMPAFVDSHVHVAVGGFDEERLLAWAKNGVCTVKELGMLCPDSEVDYLNWLKARTGPEYARVMPAAKYIDVAGGYGAGPDPSAMVGIIIETPEQAADAVSRQVSEGVAGIKIGISKGRPELTPAMVRAICGRAHELGVWVAVHLGFSDELDWLADAGIDEAAHTPGDIMSDELIEKCVKKGILFHTTISDPEAVHEMPPAAEIKDRPPVDEEAMKREEALRRENILKNLVKIRDAGGTICVGTDYIFSLHQERDACIPAANLRQMHEAGFSVQECVTCGTLNSARACRTDSFEGTIEVGKLANLVAVRGELDERFDKLKAPEFVMNRGVILRG